MRYEVGAEIRKVFIVYLETDSLAVALAEAAKIQGGLVRDTENPKEPNDEIFLPPPVSDRSR